MEKDTKSEINLNRKKDMKNAIKINSGKSHTAKAYEIFCDKRFRALLVEKTGEIYQGDRFAIFLFCQELRAFGVLYSRAQNISNFKELKK